MCIILDLSVLESFTWCSCQALAHLPDEACCSPTLVQFFLYGYVTVMRLCVSVDDKVTMELTLLVDMEVAPILNVGSEKLEDILVLHLKGGKDFFISLTGNYLPSCFGSSLEMLVKMHDYARGIPTDELLDISLVSLFQHMKVYI